MAGSAGISRTEQTADKLISMIMIEHLFAPGEKLPNEEALSKELGVSRVTLREAIRVLGAQGLVETKRGIGTFVTTNEKVFGSSLSKLNELPAKVSKELFEMRLIANLPPRITQHCAPPTKSWKIFVKKCWRLSAMLSRDFPERFPSRHFTMRSPQPRTIPT
mgnify:CR=1 FL=1